MALVDPIRIGAREGASRVLFGPHPTNLGDGRALSARHVAYYERRAAGGCGVVVCETASVHPSDWPYERAPLAGECGPGWAEVARACRPHGALVLAGLGHTGAQGSSAYSQAALWGPSPVPDAASREVPMVMEAAEIGALVGGFADAARSAVEAGADGVEVDAGATSLLRQFLSGLTNERADDYGTDRGRLLTEVLAAVRSAIGADAVLGLRLSCDELAPWAGITPEHAVGIASGAAGMVDLLTVVRGGPFSASAYRPDGHVAPGFNRELFAAVRAEVGDRAVCVAQGSVVDVDLAEELLAGDPPAMVEMTRAQIADADLVAKVRAGRAGRIRPCVLCNQRCMVRDNRNPIVSCVVDPRSGHETEDAPEPDWRSPRPVPAGPPVLVVGGGPAGMECARTLAAAGRPVELHERAVHLGGMLPVAAARPGAARFAAFGEWLAGEVDHWGVDVRLDSPVEPGDLEGTWSGVILATGSEPAPAREGDGTVAVVGAAEALAEPGSLPMGRAVVDDPVGGPVGVGVAELLAAAGREVALVAPDPVAGTQLAITGDLADANVRLARAGVERVLTSRVTAVSGGTVTVAHVWTGATRELPAAVLVDAGPRVAACPLGGEDPEDAGFGVAGDAIAPRTVAEAVLEGRRCAHALLGTPAGGHP